MGPFDVWLAQPAICVPGTSVCAASDGRGGVRVDATGRASPSGVDATGRAQADGNGNATANGNGYAQTYTQAQPSSVSSHGRSGVGTTLCPIVRLGVWSGFKAGGCVAVSFRFEALTFELETQLLYGGKTHAFDWTLPVSFLIPLANDDSLFEGPYLRFGGSPVGATFAHERDGGSFVRFGLFAGAGYELNLARWVAWRVVDLRFAFDMGTRRALDDRGHWFDPGVQLGSGLVL